MERQALKVLEYECVNKEGLDFLAPTSIAVGFVQPTVVKVKPFPWRPLCPRRPERPGPGAGRQSSHVGLMEKSMTPRHPITHNYRL